MTTRRPRRAALAAFALSDCDRAAGSDLDDPALAQGVIDERDAAERHEPEAAR